MKLLESISVWDRLKNCDYPIVMYGMGLGAQKILKVCSSRGIVISDIFATDEFVRGQDFMGYTVCKLSDIIMKYEKFIIIVAFGTHREELIDYLYHLNDRYELVSPDVPIAGEGLFDLEFYYENRHSIDDAYNIFSDDISRDTYERVVNFKISGKIDYLRPCYMHKDEIFNKILRPSDSEVFVDLGAYSGDTIEEFLGYTDNKALKIIAVEPDKKSFKRLLRNCARFDNIDFSFYNTGIWCDNRIMFIEEKRNRGSSLKDDGPVEIEVNSVDNLLNGSIATFIKFDIEGSENMGIDGAENTIFKYKPKLNIAVYHRNEDIFHIPLKIHRLNTEYEMFLRQHMAIPSWDLNLYSV